MSRRAVKIEDDFDDNTDLPLPNKPLPNTGSRGALLQSVDESDNDEDDEDNDDADYVNADRGASNPFYARPGPATPSSGQQQFFGAQNQQQAQTPREGDPNVISDVTPYKKWTCIYPIYLDAKRAYGTGERRVSRAKSLWYPLSKDIADATSRLGLSTLHEVHKCHPRDWENPGRVRVQWKKDGRLINSRIKTKKQLLEMIALHIQQVKPELIPKPPFTSLTNDPPPSETHKQPPLISKSGKPTIPSAKSKSSSTTKASSTAGSGPAPRRARLPQPPSPLPAPASRLSPYSPAVSTGMLLETVKAGMTAGDGTGAPPVGGANAGGKGKRKVIRVKG